MVDDAGTLAARIAAWSAATFPKSTAVSTLNHLDDEMEELWQVVLQDQPIANVRDEAADVLILLIQFANRTGFDLFAATEEKFARVQARTWLPPDERGVVRHDPSREE